MAQIVELTEAWRKRVFGPRTGKVRPPKMQWIQLVCYPDDQAGNARWAAHLQDFGGMVPGGVWGNTASEAVNKLCAKYDLDDDIPAFLPGAHGI